MREELERRIVDVNEGFEPLQIAVALRTSETIVKRARLAGGRDAERASATRRSIERSTGTLFPIFRVPPFNQVASNGVASVHRVRTTALLLNNLDQDQARCRIRTAACGGQPHARPFAVTRESAHVALNIS